LGKSRLTLSASLLIVLSACESAEFYDDPPIERAAALSQAEIDFAKSTLDALQPKSIAQNREYCGYIVLTPDDQLLATKAKRGRKGSCYTKDVRDDYRVLASYHTHGAFSRKFDSELPSLDDLYADIDEGIDGYIATPGGRVWLNDAAKEQAKMICGQNCITSDPEFDPSDHPGIRQHYSLDELEALEE